LILNGKPKYATAIMEAIAHILYSKYKKEKHLTQNSISDKIAGGKSPLFLCKNPAYWK